MENMGGRYRDTLSPRTKDWESVGLSQGRARLAGAWSTKDSSGPEQQGNPGCGLQLDLGVQLPLVSLSLASGGRYAPSPGGSIPISRPS